MTLRYAGNGGGESSIFSHDARSGDRSLGQVIISARSGLDVTAPGL